MTAWLLASCSGDHPAEEAVTIVRDSAGVVIVENRVDASAAICEATERLRIGEVTGAPEYELYSVFDSGELPDGSIAVTEGAGHVRVYGPDGEHRHTFGRRGDGPGEFRNPLVIASIPGDTLVVLDEPPWRFSYFYRDGTHIQSIEPTPPIFEVAEAEVFHDGRLLLAIPCCDPAVPHDYVERDLTVVVYSRTGEADTVGVFPHDEHGITTTRGSPILGGPIFGARSRVHPRADGIVYGSGRKPEIELRSLDGGLERIVRWEPGPDSVLQEDIRAYREMMADRLERMPPRFLEAQVGEERPIASWFPSLAEIQVGDDGDIWVRLYHRPDDERRQWLIFDSEGRFRCQAELPPLRVHEVGPRSIRGRIEDDLGVEYVVEYQIEKPSPGA